MKIEHGQEVEDDVVPPHRWVRSVPSTGPANHWCADGDTSHHPEPCDDAANRTGDHATDAEDGGQETWPALDESGSPVHG